MESVLQTLIGSLRGDALTNISSQLGVDEDKAQQAIGVALPLLMGALNKNSSSTDGAQALTKALQRDHDGSILKDIPAQLARKEVIEDGFNILGHVFGQKREAVGANVSKASGLDSDTTLRLLSMLAPIVLGSLGQMQRKQDLDAGGITSLLQTEREVAETKAPGILQFLDMDSDGDVTEEMVNLGANLLSSFLSKK
jgi:hypothetical protein